jgi:hypothetical protein
MSIKIKDTPSFKTGDFPAALPPSVDQFMRLLKSQIQVDSAGKPMALTPADLASLDEAWGNMSDEDKSALLVEVQARFPDSVAALLGAMPRQKVGAVAQFVSDTAAVAPTGSKRGALEKLSRRIEDLANE